jgi:hypothetical protein
LLSCIVALSSLSGCASTETISETVGPNSARCDQTGSNLPRRECRKEIEVLKPTAIESIKGADRPTMRGN